MTQTNISLCDNENDSIIEISLIRTLSVILLLKVIRDQKEVHFDEINT